MEMAVTTAAIRRAKLPSNRHHQQTNTQDFYRPDAFPVTHPTVSENLTESDRINITDVNTVSARPSDAKYSHIAQLDSLSPTLAHRAVYKSVLGIFHWGARPKDESGGGILGEEQQPPPHQLQGLGEHCELPQQGLGLCLTTQRFSTIFSTQNGLSWHYNLLIVDYNAAIGEARHPCPSPLAYVPGWLQLVGRLFCLLYCYNDIRYQEARELDLQSIGHKFKSRPLNCWVQPWASCLHTCLGHQAVTKQYNNMVQANRQWCSTEVGGAVITGLAENNGSLLSGLWLWSPANWLPSTDISSRLTYIFRIWDYIYLLQRHYFKKICRYLQSVKLLDQDHDPDQHQNMKGLLQVRQPTPEKISQFPKTCIISHCSSCSLALLLILWWTMEMTLFVHNCFVNELSLSVVMAIFQLNLG